MNISSHESPTSHDCSEHVSSSLLENSCAERFFKCFQVPSIEYVSCMILEVVVNIHANYYILKIVVTIRSKIGKS
jgi:hypothetical protein